MPVNLWNKLSKADQDMIYKATEVAGAHETELTQKQLKDAYDLVSKKMKVIVPDLASIQKKLEGAFDEYEGSKWPVGALKKVREMQ